MVAASVIVPTTRWNLIRGCLAHLGRQTIGDFEVLVVDNSPSGDVLRLGEKARLERTLRIRYLHQPRPGLHEARHMGAREARAQLLLFLDDDAEACPEWVASYIAAFRAHPEMSAAGGPIRPRWEEPPPQWLAAQAEEDLFYPLSLMDLGPEMKLSPTGFFFGANMAIRRSVLFKAGGFNPDAGAVAIRGDGETGLYRKLAKLEESIGYVPAAAVHHLIPRERMTLSYLRDRLRDEGSSNVYSMFNGRVVTTSILMRYITKTAATNAGLWLASRVFRGMTRDPVLRLHLRAALTQGRATAATRLLLDRNLRDFVLRSRWL